jgi:hypothetical protein
MKGQRPFELPVGAGAYLKRDDPLPPATFEAIKQFDAIMRPGEEIRGYRFTGDLRAADAGGRWWLAIVRQRRLSAIGKIVR